MSRFINGSRAALAAALRKQWWPSWGRAERIRALREELFLDALFLVAQFPGGQIAEAGQCCYAYDVRLCAGLCRATWAEEAFWSGMVRVRHGPRRLTRLTPRTRPSRTATRAGPCDTWRAARGARRRVRTWRSELTKAPERLL